MLHDFVAGHLNRLPLRHAGVPSKTELADSLAGVQHPGELCGILAGHMNATWRLAPWNDQGHTAFDVIVDGERAALVVSSCGLVFQFPYEIKTYGQFADPGGVNAHIIALEGWIGHEKDSNCLTLRIPSQALMPDGRGIAVPVTREQLAGLDAQRGAGSLRLSVLFLGTARVPISAQRDPTARNQHKVLTRPEVGGEVQAIRTSGSIPVTLEISREHWLGILSAAGPRQYRLIELPLHKARMLNQPLALLEEATVVLRRGEWGDAVSKARKVVEGVLVESANHWGVTRPTDGHPKWCEALGKRLENAWPGDPMSGILFGRLLASAWSWTSEEHHYSPSVTSKRVEAEFAIGLASDLLLLADELMTTYPQLIVSKSVAPEPLPQNDVETAVSLLDYARIAILDAAPMPDDAHLLDDTRVIGRAKSYTVVYGPFASVPNPKAEVIFVGLTPGRSQTRDCQSHCTGAPHAHCRRTRRRAASRGRICRFDAPQSDRDARRARTPTPTRSPLDGRPL